jgi:hypothetical protein
MLAVREAIGMLSPPHRAAPDLPFAARRTHHACRPDQCGKCQPLLVNPAPDYPAQPGLRTAGLRPEEREMEKDTDIITAPNGLPALRRATP